jgi:hypothetical protein
MLQVTACKERRHIEHCYSSHARTVLPSETANPVLEVPEGHKVDYETLYSRNNRDSMNTMTFKRLPGS